MPDRLPSEELLDARIRMPELALLCGIYDQLCALNEALAPKPQPKRADPKPKENNERTRPSPE